MATHTWKIGEYCKGGIITVNTTPTTVTVIGKDWDFSKGSNRGSDQSGAKEWTRETVKVNDSNAYRTLFDFLNDLTTSYYADQILQWIKTKVTINNRVNGLFW